MDIYQKQYNPQKEIIDLDKIKEWHNRLYQEVQDAKEELKSNYGCRSEFIKQIDSLIVGMRKISEEIKRGEDYSNYDWLDMATTKWQEVFSWIFAEPRKVRDEIGLAIRPIKVLSSRERRVIPHSKIRSDMAIHAYLIGQERSLEPYRRPLREFERDRNRIYEMFPSSFEEEREDWHTAAVYFAADVLTGKIDLAYQLGAESYRELEEVYLDEVKKLEAYRIWEERKGSWGLSEMGTDYLYACEKLRQVLLNPGIKAPRVDFEDLGVYLRNNYNVGESSSKGYHGSPALEGLKRRKADRIWRNRSYHFIDLRKQMERDWSLAEEHIHLFYDNVIPAIEGNPVNIIRVMRSLGARWRQYGIINCLEAAIAFYFFDPELIRKYSDNEFDII